MTTAVMSMPPLLLLQAWLDFDTTYADAGDVACDIGDADTEDGRAYMKSEQQHKKLKAQYAKLTVAEKAEIAAADGHEVKSFAELVEFLGTEEEKQALKPKGTPLLEANVLRAAESLIPGAAAQLVDALKKAQKPWPVVAPVVKPVAPVVQAPVVNAPVVVAPVVNAPVVAPKYSEVTMIYAKNAIKCVTPIMWAAYDIAAKSEKTLADWKRRSPDAALVLRAIPARSK